MKISSSLDLSSNIKITQQSNAQLTLTKDVRGVYADAFHAVSELLATPSSPKLSLKRAMSITDIQKMITLQNEMQRHHLGVELVARLSESVLSITKKIQNG
jgi:hypothetical protein